MFEFESNNATKTYQTVSIVAPIAAMTHFVLLDIEGSRTEESTASMKTAIFGFKNAMK